MLLPAFYVFSPSLSRLITPIASMIFSHDFHHSYGQVVCCVGVLGILGAYDHSPNASGSFFSLIAPSLLLLPLPFLALLFILPLTKGAVPHSFAHYRVGSGGCSTLFAHYPVGSAPYITSAFYPYGQSPNESGSLTYNESLNIQAPNNSPSCVVGRLLIRGDGVLHFPALRGY